MAGAGAEGGEEVGVVSDQGAEKEGAHKIDKQVKLNQLFQ